MIDSSTFTKIRNCGATSEMIEISQSNLVIAGNTLFRDWQCNRLSVLFATTSNILVTARAAR